LTVIKKTVKQINLYTILIQGTSTIFVEQMSTHLFFSKSAVYGDIKIFNILPCSLTIPKNEKAKFKVKLRKYLNMHSIYSADEFFICKVDF